MIIENLNNVLNCNYLFFNRINSSKLNFIIKKLIFFASNFLIIGIITFKLYIINNNIIHIKKKKELYNEEISSLDDSSNFKRDLDIINYHNKNLSIENILKEKMNKEFSFILNLTSNEYIGNWTQLSMNDTNFFDKNINTGLSELYFHKAKSNSLSILTRTRINSLKIDAIIKEGKYIDKNIKVNFTFFLENNLDKYLQEDKSFVIHNNNINIDFSKIEFLKGKKNETLNNVNVTLKVANEDHIYSPTFRKRNYSPFYKIILIISSKYLNITINTKISNNENLNNEVRLYSFIMSFLGIIEIYYCSKLIMKINIHREIAKKLSLITISINCCFNLIICLIHFLLSISIIEEELSYQFGIITIIYFFCFIGFELKLLLLIFRIKNEFEENMQLYRRRLLGLYLLFYVCFSLIFFNIKVCLTNYYLILSIYTLSWLSQIIFSIYKNQRPPMSRLYIVWNSINRLFLPIYAKGIDKNFFDLKPSYFKVGLLVIIIIFEAIILILQKSLGARIIIPKKCRKQNQRFDYYRDKVNIEKHVSKNPICVICLENLNVDVDENFNKVKKKKKSKTLGAKILNFLYLDLLNEKIKKCIKYLEGKNLKKKYMITPCDHVYHTVCLEKWMKQKNECPYCKTKIPTIDA